MPGPLIGPAVFVLPGGLIVPGVDVVGCGAVVSIEFSIGLRHGSGLLSDSHALCDAELCAARTGFSSTSSRVAMMGFSVRIRIFGLRPQTQTGNDGGQVTALGRVLEDIFDDAVFQRMKGNDGETAAGLQMVDRGPSMPWRTAPSSSLTAMRMAWKLRLAGCCFSPEGAGRHGRADDIDELERRSMGWSVRTRSMAAAICGA